MPAPEQKEREKERRTGKVRITRRMDRSEGVRMNGEVPVEEIPPEPSVRAR